MVIQVGNKSICLNRFIEDILYHEGFQISNTVKDNWVVATKKIYGLPNASYIVRGKYPTRGITKKQYNGRMEIYMNNGWQVNVHIDLSNSNYITDARLVGVPTI